MFPWSLYWLLWSFVTIRYTMLMLLWVQIQATGEWNLYSVHNCLYLFMSFVSITHLYKEKTVCPIPECNFDQLELHTFNIKGTISNIFLLGTFKKTVLHSKASGMHNVEQQQSLFCNKTCEHFKSFSISWHGRA